MNVNKLIKDTLQPLIPNVNTLLPTVSPNVYTGTEKTYITFNYEDDRAIDFADDTPQTDIATIMIHLFTPTNYMALKKQIRLKLFQAGFSYPSITEFYETDTKLNHIVFQCEIEGQSESEEI